MASNVFSKLPAPIRYWLGILSSALQNWVASQAFIYAAALAFFTVFSIAPILVVVVTLVGVFVGEQAVAGELFREVEATIGAEAAGVVHTGGISWPVDQRGIRAATTGR